MTTRCNVSGCINTKYQDSDYCSLHKCATDGCNEHRYYSYKGCQNHICVECHEALVFGDRVRCFHCEIINSSLKKDNGDKCSVCGLQNCIC